MLASLLPALTPVASAAIGRPTWSELERRLPSSVAPAAPAVLSAAQADTADLEGKAVLYRDRNGWCPYSERIWLALELKKAEYVTCLVDDDYSVPPGDEGSLPRFRCSDGTTYESSDIVQILERIDKEYPQPPLLFPDVSVSVALVRDSFERFDGIMPRFTRPSTLTPYVFACRIQRAGSFEIEECGLGELVPKYKFEVSLEEIEETLEEYAGPFFAGKSVSAIDSAPRARVQTDPQPGRRSNVMRRYSPHMQPTAPLRPRQSVARPSCRMLLPPVPTHCYLLLHAFHAVTCGSLLHASQSVTCNSLLRVAVCYALQAVTWLLRVAVCYAPFLERLAAYLPILYPGFRARGGRFEALTEWYAACVALTAGCRLANGYGLLATGCTAAGTSCGLLPATSHALPLARCSLAPPRPASHCLVGTTRWTRWCPAIHAVSRGARRRGSGCFSTIHL